jgi:hypothetical protein
MENKYAGTAYEWGFVMFRAKHGTPDQKAEAKRVLRELGSA